MWRSFGGRGARPVGVVIILAGILSGVFTATESASVAVIYALLMTIFVYRSCRGKLPKAAAKAVQDHRRRAAADRHLGDVPVPDQPLQVAELTGRRCPASPTNPWVIFFLVNLILFVLGTFLDMAATILICTPIFLPIASSSAWTRCSSAW